MPKANLLPFPWAVASALLLGFTIATPVRGQPTTPGSNDIRRECNASYESAQLLRESGNLLEALDSLVKCSQPSCLPAVRNDCVQWFQEVTQAVPTIVVSARSSEQDLLDVHVLVDGRLVAKRLDGRPLELNPGTHKFRFETPGYAAEERQVLLVPGEKLRPIVVSFDVPERRPSPSPPEPVENAFPPAGAAASDGPGRETANEPAPERDRPAASGRPVPLLSYVFGAVALAGIGSFVGFALSGLEDYNSLESSCRPACESSKVDAVRTKLVVADVSLGVALASAVTATVLYINRPHARPSEQQSKAGLEPVIDLDPARESATLAIGGRF
jgi:hypothetical protein